MDVGARLGRIMHKTRAVDARMSLPDGAIRRQPLMTTSTAGAMTITVDTSATWDDDVRRAREAPMPTWNCRNTMETL